MEDNYLIRDCNKCKYINTTEDQQSQSKEPHICSQTNNKLYHKGCHPILPAYLNDCPLMSYFELEITKKNIDNFKHNI